MSIVTEAVIKRPRKVPNGSTVKETISLSDFLITAASAQGGRKYMEDRLHIEVGRNLDGGLEFIYAAVYDGHGGPQASEYVRRHLFANIVSNQNFFSDDDQIVLGAIRTGFLRTHSNMQREAEHWPPTTSGFPCTAGTTATCVFIRNGKLYSGHVGDSSIILTNFLEDDAGFNDAKLTDDHKPELKSERLRIERAGGAVAAKSGIVRVIWKRPIRGHRGPVRRSTTTENIPFLAVARSLGDFWSLNPDSNEYVMLMSMNKLDVDVFELKDTDNFIVIATDGLTNVIGIRTIIQLLRESEQIAFSLRDSKVVAQPNSLLIDDIVVVNKDFPLNYAHCLLQHAFKKWATLRADNISVIVIKLNATLISANIQRAVASDDGNMDVCEVLTEYPTRMIRVNNECTQSLNCNSFRHRYFGTLDKGLNFSQRFGSTSDNLPDRTSVGCNTRRKKNQLPAQFKGPGFVCPEMVGDGNNNINNRLSGGLCEFIVSEDNINVSTIVYESDVEEPKSNSTSATRQSQSSSLVEQHQSIPSQTNTGSDHVLRRGRADEMKHSKSNSKEELIVKAPVKHSMPSRSAQKRRLDDANDGYESMLPGGTNAKKLSLEEQQDEEELGGSEMKPPPAKRSRIQTVVNFFTSLFRWAI